MKGRNPRFKNSENSWQRSETSSDSRRSRFSLSWKRPCRYVLTYSGPLLHSQIGLDKMEKEREQPENCRSFRRFTAVGLLMDLEAYVSRFFLGLCFFGQGSARIEGLKKEPEQLAGVWNFQQFTAVGLLTDLQVHVKVSRASFRANFRKFRTSSSLLMSSELKDCVPLGKTSSQGTCEQRNLAGKRMFQSRAAP